MLKGRCHCGAIRYEMPEAEVRHHALCHCADCRRHAGAPMVAWAMVPAERLSVAGRPVVYRSSEHGRRHFCGACGTSLFYVNEAVLPGMIDVQTGTLDNPDALPAQAHIQVAERIAWMRTAHELPTFERYPG
jgi:hypothetical protein